LFDDGLVVMGVGKVQNLDPVEEKHNLKTKGNFPLGLGMEIWLVKMSDSTASAMLSN